MDNAKIGTAPYQYNGLLWSNGLTGSASMVAPGVMATAAHLLYDEDQSAWVPIGSVRYYGRYHSNTDPFFSTAYQTPVAFQRWTSYYPQRVAIDQSEGFSSLDTFNVDFATGYFGTGVTAPEVILHADVNVDASNAGDGIGNLRLERDKLIIGYPSDISQIPAAESGLMHEHPAADYYAEWNGFDDLPNQQKDSGGYWWSIYFLSGVTTYAGCSGGPVFVKDDTGGWNLSGIVVGDSGSNSLLVRAIDDNAYEWIEEAIFLRGNPTLTRVDNLAVVAAGHREVKLEWTDHSSGEAGFKVFRQSMGVWEELASLGPDAEAFTDTTALPGKVYHYKVQPFAANGNRAPKSLAASARTLGNNLAVTTHLSQPWLQFTTRGDSGWYMDGANRLRSGKVNALQQSGLMLEILGPGTLQFQWSVSSEENPDYATPGPEQGRIYDALYLYLNGAPAFDGGEPLFISGNKGPQSFSVPLSDGSWQVEWRYEKNAYNSAGADAGYLDSLSWTPAANPYPVYGAFEFEGTEWHGSEWLGVYYTEFRPWVIHLELGWMAFTGTPDGWLVGSSTLQLPHPPYKIGTFYTNPYLFPYFYLPATNTWIYYAEGTGLWGKKAWFWIANTNQWTQTP